MLGYEAMGPQLGVGKTTISTDLIDIVRAPNNVKDRGTDTRGRKKSSGRVKEQSWPKSSAKIHISGFREKFPGRAISHRSSLRYCQKENPT
jgi:hypothetical protein